MSQILRSLVLRIDRRGIHYRTTHDIYRNDLFAPRYVLTTRTEEDGLLFWNIEAGFGELRDATIYSEKEALGMDPIIAADEPEFLELPSAL